MEQALALNPKAILIYRNLVPAYVALGDRKKRKRTSIRSLEIFPGSQ